MYNNHVDYKNLIKAIHSFVCAKEAFAVNPRGATFIPSKVIQRPDAGQRKIEDKVDSLASQLSELSLIIKKSQTSNTIDTDTKTCSYCRELGHFATNCPKNEHRTTKCSAGGKLGHPESRCFKKQKKDIGGANAIVPEDNEEDRDTQNTVEVTLVENIREDSTDHVVASVKRTANGKALPKQIRPNSTIPISSLLAPDTRLSVSKPITRKVKKVKNKRTSSNEGIAEYVGKYDVISELAKRKH